jgi:DNA-binding transcriptional regulator YbjK
MKPISARVTEHDHVVIEGIVKEFHITNSELIRNAVLREIRRLKSLTSEEKIAEINENLEWERAKKSMFDK